MDVGYIYKPQTRKGPVFLAPQDLGPPVITGPDGTEYVGERADRHGGTFFGEAGYQYVFDPAVIGLSDATITYGDQSGKIGKGSRSYRGAGIDTWDESDKGAIGSPGGVGVDPTGYGFFPNDISDQFPSPVLTGYDPITKAPYQFTDPLEFAKKFGEYNREELYRSNQQAKEFALDALATELEGLEGFVAGSSAIKRRETSLDNIFNQQERERQINSALPNARGDLAGQRSRALAYAEGRIPDAIADRALELGIRSDAADRASSGGFGATSSVARKASDLMSAQERVKLGMEGERILSGNINQEAGLFVAPTQYSDAGAQVRTMPTLSGSQLQTQARQEISQFTGIPTRDALSSTVQQNQFDTGLEQQTRQFNASNTLQNDQFNATNQNAFALELWGYKVALEGAKAGAFQTGSNTALQLQQQQQAFDLYKQYAALAQANQQFGAIAQTLTTLLGGAGGGGGILSTISNIVKDITNVINNLGGVDDVPASDNGVELEPGGPDTEGAPPGQGGNVEFEPGGPDTEGAPEGQGDNVAEGSDVGDSGMSTEEGPVSEAFSADARSFKEVTGRSLQGRQLQAASKTADSILKSGGLSYKPDVNMKLAGYDTEGRAVYTSKAAESNDARAGSAAVKTIKSILDPFGGFTKEDGTTLEKIGSAASDVSFIANLDAIRQRGDKKAFINAILQKVGGAYIKENITDGRNQAGAGAALGALKLFTTWDNMSTAQKSLTLASTGMKLFKFADGGDLARQVIPGTKIAGTPGMTYGQALSLMNTGYNVYGLVKNWGQLSNIERIAGGTGAVANIAQTAKDLNLLGSGPTNAAVEGVTQQSLAQIGATPAPGYGVGSLVLKQGGSVPAGYTATGTTQTGRTVVTPTSNIGTAVRVVGGAASVALGARAVYKGWGMGGAKGGLNGALGGSAVVAGLGQLMGGGVTSMLGSTTVLGPAAPFVAAGIIAGSVLGNSIKTGKSVEQKARDGGRSLLRKVGVADDKYEVKLADGAKFNIGLDAGGGHHSITDRSKLSPNQKGLQKLRAYDIDYTNDLDYASGMTGISLMRLLSGGKATNVDQIGGQVGNAALGNIGYGKEMTRENFEKMAANQRGFYSQSGITNKNDAYALANQAYAEGRIDETDLVSMHQSFNMIYDNNGYDTAKRLMVGRHNGIQNADKIVEDVKPQPVEAAEPTGDTRVVTQSRSFNRTPQRRSSSAIMSKEAAKRANARRYGAQRMAG